MAGANTAMTDSTSTNNSAIMPNLRWRKRLQASAQKPREYSTGSTGLRTSSGIVGTVDMLRVSHPGIDDGVQNVGQQLSHEREHREQQHQAHDCGVIFFA